MTKQLAKPNTSISISEDIIENLPTITPKKMAKISERMVEIDRARQTGGKKNTQTTIQLMTLTMLTDSPYRRLRQILVQIERKRDAVESNYFRHKKLLLRIKKWQEKGDEFSLIRIDESMNAIERGKVYLDGSLREIGALQDAYEEIRKNNNIPENWDEENAELDEINHHVRQVFRQGHRDMTLTGHITQGNAEYFEQYGVHLQTAQKVIGDYIDTCEKMMIEDGVMPTVDHLYEFLDVCVKNFGEEYKKVMSHIGIEDLSRSEWLFKNNVNRQ